MPSTHRALHLNARERVASGPSNADRSTSRSSSLASRPMPLITAMHFSRPCRVHPCRLRSHVSNAIFIAVRLVVGAARGWRWRRSVFICTELRLRADIARTLPRRRWPYAPATASGTISTLQRSSRSHQPQTESRCNTAGGRHRASVDFVPRT